MSKPLAIVRCHAAPANYDAFLASKRLAVAPTGIDNPPALAPSLFAFQHDVTRWALRRGRAALFADCGLGKGWMALEWARVVAAHTRTPTLIVAPLGVARQFVHEAAKLAVPVTLCRGQEDVRGGINVTNYERLHRFTPHVFAGVVLDESSILKDYASATRNALIEAFAATPFRLCCTATPAPNDYMELGNHAEFLGVMTRSEMLAMFFTHDGGETQTWRLKGHAEATFWRWVANWAVAITKPSDLGYVDDGYVLPRLSIRQHVVPCGPDVARQLGMLFATEVQTLGAQRAARRGSLETRVATAAALIRADPQPWICWCDLNAESAALTAAIPGAIEVTGSMDADEKERRIWEFIEGRAHVLVTKPSIAGHGLNLQMCARVAFVGITHSFEAWYQAIRRTYRFGQTRRVECHLITSEAEGAVLANLTRKQHGAERMSRAMSAAMADITRAELGQQGRDVTDYRPTAQLEVPSWLAPENQ